MFSTFVGPLGILLNFVFNSKWLLFMEHDAVRN